jgi:hypothetical protein
MLLVSLSSRDVVKVERDSASSSSISLVDVGTRFIIVLVVDEEDIGTPAADGTIFDDFCTDVNAVSFMKLLQLLLLFNR